MLFPQFTIRRMLLITMLAAILSLIAEFARRGSVLAQSAVMMALLLFGFFFLSALIVQFVSLWSRVIRREKQGTGESPFAEHRPPPQLIHPEDPA